jgi:predicted Zn-dependent peptidase
VVASPAFREDEVDCERQVILEELSMHEDTPDDLVHSIFAEALFPGHRIGREVLGDVGTVENMTRDQIAGFHAAHYRSGNLVVAAAGNITHEQIVDGVAARFADSAGERPARELGPPTAASAVRVLNRPTEQAHLVVGMPGLSRSDPDRYALSVLNQVLGGGMSSRLFQEIRERRGLAYSVYSYRAAYEDAGLLAVYAGTAPQRAPAVLDIISAEFDRLVADGGVQDGELERAKGNFKGQMALGLEGSSSRMERLGRSELTSGEILGVDELVGRIEQVTSDDIARVISRIFVGAPRVLAAVGPLDADALAR